MNILIFDDYLEFHMLAREFISSEHFVFKALNSKAALDVLRKQSIQILILDFHMTLENVPEFLTIAKDENKLPPLIVYMSKSALNLNQIDFVKKMSGASSRFLVTEKNQDGFELLRSL